MTPRPLRLVSAFIALALTIGVTHLGAPPVAAVDGQAYVSLSNLKRASVGKGPVAYSALLEQISDERATKLAQTDVFEHDMAYVSQRLKAAGACITGLGEIIAWERGYPTYDPARTIESWWASPGHRAIMVGDYNGAGGSHVTSTASNKLYSVMVWVKFCSAPPVTTTNNTDITRLAGADRYATAAAISRATFSAGVSVAYVATGANFPDALAGAAAAARHEAPVLLVRPSELPDATRTELARLRPASIVILGGTGAVSDGVRAQLASLATSGSVQRLAGANRYATAAAISRATFLPGVAKVYIATGQTFPDALSGGALAGRDGGPVLLVTAAGIPAETRGELARLRPGSIVILGGTGAVSDVVKSQLAGLTTSGRATRLSGADRYATAVAASKSGFAGGSTAAFVATGMTFPDGLAGGPVAALVPGPVLLVKPTDMPDAVGAELLRLGADEVFILGSTGAISTGVVNEIAAVLP